MSKTAYPALVNIPNTKFKVVNGSGHLIPIDEPVQLANEIASFVGKLAPRKPATLMQIAREGAFGPFPSLIPQRSHPCSRIRRAQAPAISEQYPLFEGGCAASGKGVASHLLYSPAPTQQSCPELKVGLGCFPLSRFLRAATEWRLLGANIPSRSPVPLR